MPEAGGLDGAFMRERERQYQSHRHHQHRIPSQLLLIMAIGPLPDALKPGIHGVRAHWIRGIHGVRAHWIRGFMAFHYRGCGRSPFPRPAPQCYSRVTRYRRRH